MKTNILTTAQNLSVELQVTITAVAVVVILVGFIYLWAKTKFTIVGFVIGLASAGLAGWAIFGGLGWMRDQARGAIEAASLHSDLLLASTGSLL